MFCPCNAVFILIIQTPNRTRVNQFMSSGLFYLNSLDQPISSLKDVWSAFIIIMFYKMLVFNANSVATDHTPRSVASDLGLQCLPMSNLWDARYKWVKYQQFYSLEKLLYHDVSNSAEWVANSVDLSHSAASDLGLDWLTV